MRAVALIASRFALEKRRTTMTRNNKQRMLAATVLVLVSLTAAGAWQFMSGESQPPSLAEVMSTSSALTENLYPAVDPSARVPGVQSNQADQADQKDSTDKTNQVGTSPERSFSRMDNGRLVASFTTNRDKTSEEVYYQNDGIGRSYLVDFYAPLASDPGPRQKGIVFYAADGESLNSEEWDRLDGTAEKIGHALGGGYYVSSTLFADGQTAETEQLWAPDMFSTGHVPKLEKETRWRSPAEGHIIAYTDVLNDDGTREQTSFDAAGLPTMQKHIPLRPPIGTTVKEFFPGTTRVRLESATDWWTTVATVYRLDGTRSRVITLRSASFDVRYFDPTGKVPTFEQTWLKRLGGSGVKNGAGNGAVPAAAADGGAATTVKGPPQPVYWLSAVVELNADGSSRRVTAINDKGQVTDDMWLKCTVDGITYERVFFWYREDGTLSKTELMNPENASNTPMKTVEHTAAENIKVVLPQAHLAPIETPDELPVPPDNQPTGGH
jgi:hypothetical protein